MGNTLPSAAAATGTSGSGTSTDMSISSDQNVSSTNEGATTTSIELEGGVSGNEKTNPGTFEEMHKKCKDVYPVVMDGMSLVLNRGLSNHFQVHHKVNLPQATPASYNFGATYVGTKQFGPTESFPVLLGEMDGSGSLNAQIIHGFTRRLKSKLVAQTQKEKFQMVQGELEYKGDEFTASVATVNPDPLNLGGVFLAHYLQTVTPQLTLGGEFLFTRGGANPVNSVITVAARYRTPIYSAAANLGPGGINATYWHKANENIQFGLELESSLRAKESTVSLGYQVDLPQAEMTFKGTLDSNWTIAGVLEKKLYPLPLSLLLSGTLNHKREACRFGMGLHVGN